MEGEGGGWKNFRKQGEESGQVVAKRSINSRQWDKRIKLSSLIKKKHGGERDKRYLHRICLGGGSMVKRNPEQKNF